MADEIGRTLACKDREGRQQVIGEAEIPTFREPVIILGDPGMGKSVLCRSLDVLPRMKRVEAAALVRDRDPESLDRRKGTDRRRRNRRAGFIER